MLKCLDLLLLLTIFEPIVCTNKDMPTTRHNRSSFIGTTKALPDYESPLAATKPRSSFNKTDWGIFIVGTEKYPVIFNTSVIARHSDVMHADDPTVTQPSTQEPSFKVQRLPDGKLSLVFNDLPYLQPPTQTTHKRPLTKYDDKITFPDQYHEMRREVQCRDPANAGKSFCIEVHDYPEEKLLDELLRSDFSKYESFFSEDLTQPQNVTQRMNYEPDDLQLCRSHERVVYPKAGETIDAKWLKIINNDNHKQGIRIEECENVGNQCEIISGILPNGYRATCKQIYIYRQLVAIQDNVTLTKDHFKVPSCCKCVLRQD